MIFNNFDHSRDKAFLSEHEDGTLLVTLKDCREFSLITLDDPGQGSPVVAGTRYGGEAVRFVADDVLFVMPMLRDPRMIWPEQVAALADAAGQAMAKEDRGKRS